VKTEATQTINIPRGARVGYEVQVAGAGNDVYENLQLSKGNFLLRVDEIVMPSSAFKLFDDRVEATVMMSVKDALKVNTRANSDNKIIDQLSKYF
jgi:DnaJ-class molecular chaperone